MKIILLSYINRSGSTFLLNQLSKIPEVGVCPEADILFNLLLSETHEKINEKILQTIILKLENDSKWQSWKTDLSPLNTFTGNRYDMFYQIVNLFQKTHYHNAKYIVFKHNYLLSRFNELRHEMDLLWLVLLRNPMAVYASQKNTVSPATHKIMCSNPLALIDQWNQLYKRYVRLKDNNRIGLIQYEELISSINLEMEYALNFLGIKSGWNECKYNSGTLENWLSNDYKRIHTNIEAEPQNKSLEKWKKIVNRYELSVLNKFMIDNQYYPKVESKKNNLANVLYITYCRFDRKFQKIRKLIRDKIRNHV
jgi:hypothetical protein